MIHLQLESGLRNVRGIAQVIVSPKITKAVLQIWTQSSHVLSSYSCNIKLCNHCARAKIKGQTKNKK